MKKLALIAASLGAVATSPAMAANTVPACPAAFSASPGLVSCKFVAGNVLGGSASKVGAQEDAIESLLGLPAGAFTVNWAPVDASKSLFTYADDLSTSSNIDGILTSTRPLFGQTILGIHFGNGNPSVGNGTAFLLFNFATPITSINLTAGKAFSTGALFQTRVAAVPEPSTWAMLILGFGVVGGALRGARKQRPALNYV